MVNERNPIANVVKSLFTQIREINQRYKKPKLKMTPLVRISLIGLRIYLLAMVLIMVYKFIMIAIFK